ncbi:hypothetical protein [Streptomyces sp. NPDC029554]|uniref:hypothetical protein n=1 Tax=Streptomyces sp. NPDC029554 TaxID=3155126 RepID=UPI0033DBC927
MNLADELRTAAQTLMDLADVAQEDLDTADYWKPYNQATAWRDGLVNGFGGSCSDLVAVFTPTTAHALAAWLRAEAAIWDAVETVKAEYGPKGLKVTTPLSTHDQALAVARAINGTETTR